jgi:hypothetical protein
MKLTREEAVGLLEAVPHPDVSVVHLEEVHLSRWTRTMQLVVMDGQGRYWAAEYDEGLTEMQDTSPWDDQDEVEFTEVKKVPVTTYRYEKK